MEVGEARRLPALEDENVKLKKLLAETMLDNVALKELFTKTSRARCSPGGRDASANGSRPVGTAGLFHHRR